MAVSWNLSRQHCPWRRAARHTARPSVTRCAAQHADTHVFSRKKDPLLLQQTSSHQNPAKKSSCLSKRRENRSAAISVPLPQTAAPRGWRRCCLDDAAFELHTAASLTKNSCCKAPKAINNSGGSDRIVIIIMILTSTVLTYPPANLSTCLSLLIFNQELLL